MMNVSIPSTIFNNNSLSDQHTAVQQDTEVVARETSDFDSNDLESALEITSQEKSSAPLSLVEGTTEVILQESVPEEVTLDITIEEDRITEAKGESKPSINIRGQFLFKMS